MIVATGVRKVVPSTSMLMISHVMLP